MTADLVGYHLDGAGVAWITFTDAERGNPLSPQSVDDFQHAVSRAGEEGARVVVLGARGRFFSVGGDLRTFAEAGVHGRAGALVDDLAAQLHRAVADLMAADYLVIASVHGPAVGAAFPLVASADVVVAAESATFSLGYLDVGLSVDGGTSLLVRSLGLHRVLQLALLGDSLSAARAQQLGLVARVCPDDELVQVTGDLATQLATRAQPAASATKRLLRRVAGEVEPHLAREQRAIRTAADSPDGLEGVRAFLEKRRPSFGTTVHASSAHREP